MRVLHETIVSVALTADYASPLQDYTSLYVGSIQITWTGTPAGTFQPQESDDGITWFDKGTPQAAGGAVGTKLYSFTDIGTRYLRLKFTFTSSTGSANIIFVGKGV